MTDVAVTKQQRGKAATATPGPVASCDVCPVRSTAQDSSYGYCEGCPSRLRLCRSCERYQPQVGWGFGTFGLVFAQFAWVCGDCRFHAADAVADHPRFKVRLPVPSGTRLAAQVGRELERAADRDHHHPAVEVLRRIAAAMTAAGGVDVDASDLSLADRRAVLTVLTRLHGDVPHATSEAVYALVRAWERFVDVSAELPFVPSPTPTVGQRAIALGLERDA